MALIYFIVLKNRAFRVPKKTGEWRDVRKWACHSWVATERAGAFIFSPELTGQPNRHANRVAQSPTENTHT